jgi:hypothetical protein
MQVLLVYVADCFKTQGKSTKGERVSELDFTDLIK